MIKTYCYLKNKGVFTNISLDTGMSHTESSNKCDLSSFILYRHLRWCIRQENVFVSVLFSHGPRSYKEVDISMPFLKKGVYISSYHDFFHKKIDTPTLIPSSYIFKGIYSINERLTFNLFRLMYLLRHCDNALPDSVVCTTTDSEGLVTQSVECSPDKRLVDSSNLSKPTL